MLITRPEGERNARRDNPVLASIGFLGHEGPLENSWRHRCNCNGRVLCIRSDSLSRFPDSPLRTGSVLRQAGSTSHPGGFSCASVVADRAHVGVASRDGRNYPDQEKNSTHKLGVDVARSSIPRPPWAEG